MRPRLMVGIATLSLSAWLAGCASQGAQRHLEEAGAYAQRELGVALRWNDSEQARRTAEAQRDTLLGKPLDADGAVRLALGYSPSFQALLAERMSDTARITQSARLPNPVFEFERVTVADVAEIDRKLALSVLDLLTWPARRGVATAKREELRARLAADVVRTATDARAAWIEAVAAQQAAKYAEQVHEAAAAAAELGRRMSGAGNFSRIEQAREQAFLADAVTALAIARLEARQKREALVRRLGLRADAAARLELPGMLPAVPAQPRAGDEVASRAMAERLDVRMSQSALLATARSLGLTRVTSTVDLLSAGAVRKSSTGEEDEEGFQSEIRLPIFDWGDARRAEARAIYLAALARTAQTLVDAESGTAEAYEAYRTAHTVARHYADEIVPLRKAISEQNLLLYNGMLISVFELLADMREQIDAVRRALDAQRDYWLADAALRATLLGLPAELPTLAAPSMPAAGGGKDH